MAKILFRLRYVTEEEADEVRALLDQHAIDWYETSAGRFQISFPAIWLQDESQEVKARALLEDYQRDRAATVRREQAERVERGEADTFYSRLRAQPILVLLAMAAIVFILFISIRPFLSLMPQS